MIDVILAPQFAGNRQIQGQIIVVLDILRATSTIVTALGNRALQVIPVIEPEDAFSWKQKNGKNRCLIGGERRGYKVEGFDLGNSPAEYSRMIVAGKEIILCTSNGTKAIKWAEKGREVLVGSFLNMEMIVEYLQSNCNNDTTIICSGREGDISLEDLAAAGMIVTGLSEQHELTDTAKIAQYTYEMAKDTGITAFVGQTEHGRYLSRIGMKTDIEQCTDLNKFPILPRFRDGVVRVE